MCAEEYFAETDIGPPDFKEMLPPVIKRNYGKWKYHENPRPGVLVHTAESGEKLYSIRMGSGRLVSTDYIRELADLVVGSDRGAFVQLPVGDLQGDSRRLPDGIRDLAAQDESQANRSQDAYA